MNRLLATLGESGLTTRAEDPLPPAQPRFALVTSTAYPLLYEDDLMRTRALEEIGISAIPAIWNDARVE